MPTRTTVTLSIEPDLCGPVSIGTVRVIQLLRRHFELGLDEAVAAVERSAFSGEAVALGAPSPEAARSFVEALAAPGRGARVRAVLSTFDLDQGS